MTLLIRQLLINHKDHQSGSTFAFNNSIYLSTINVISMPLYLYLSSCFFIISFLSFFFGISSLNWTFIRAVSAIRRQISIVQRIVETTTFTIAILRKYNITGKWAWYKSTRRVRFSSMKFSWSNEWGSAKRADV